MPVEFLSEDEVAGFGRFPEGRPGARDLARWCLLDVADLERVEVRRSDALRLGYAVQLVTVRWLGAFLDDPLGVPWEVVVDLAGQLGIVEPSCVRTYAQRLKTVYEHQWSIRAEYGYRDFASGEADLVAFLDARCELRQETARVTFEAAAAWLRAHQVLLPGASVLARLVSQRRTACDEAFYRVIVDLVAASDPTMLASLEELLVVPEGSWVSELERLRRGADRVSVRQMLRSLTRVEELAGLGAGVIDLSAVPQNRVDHLARDGLVSKASLLRTRAPLRRSATLAVTLRALYVAAIDDAVDLFSLLMATRLVRVAQRVSREEQLRNLPKLSIAAVQLAHVVRFLVAQRERDDSMAELWVRLEREVGPWDEMEAAADTVEDLVPDPDPDLGWRAELVQRFGQVRGFLVLMNELIPFGATTAGQPILQGWRQLPGLLREARGHHVALETVDPVLLAGSWRTLAVTEHGVDVRAYTLCVLESLWRAMRRRDIFVVVSARWRDPHVHLLQGDRWRAMRDEVVTALAFPRSIEQHLDELAAALDAAWDDLGDRIDSTADSAVTVEQDERGKTRVHAGRITKLEEPASLIELRKMTDRMLPRVDLPEVILEVHRWTGFLDEFAHIAGGDARLDELAVSVAAVMVAEACNIGLRPVTNRSIPALTRGRLLHVEQNYVRADTIKAANARLINAQADIDLARCWGGGLVASIDGLRFVIPVNTINAGANPRYFGQRRGGTWLNAINDQTMGIGAQLVPGTPRDSLHTLDVILNPDGGPRPEFVTSDTASYSDLVFGLYQVCGMRFAPRIADLTDTRFWRIDPTADYGPVNDLARHRVNLSRIRPHWEDMLRVSGSLTTGTVRAYDLIRALGRDGQPTPLGQAFIEYGRIAKTLHLLAVIDPDDDSYRRAINTQLTVQESRHRLARKIFYGQRGELRQKYRDGQEDQLGLLGLLVNTSVLWTTRYLDAAITHLRAIGHTTADDDLARLSPLQDEHLDVLGRYTFAVPALDGLRPLRQPKPATDDDDDT